MVDVLLRIAASVVCATLFCLASVKTLGAVQQSGYKSRTFLRWLCRKENMLENRLCVLSLCLALASAVFSLCFSFLSATGALALSSLPFFALLLLYYYADGKYALKVPVHKTGRFYRLFAVYFLFVASFCYALISLLNFLSVWNGSALYALIAYIPFSLTPALLPFLLAFANAVEGFFENIRNKKFVKRAGQVLDETEIIRVAVVGSYGKTSVKNILKAVLSQKYTVVETPASFNTPVGLAKTVFSPQFAEKQVLIAEMGARKAGDIAELCALVKPDYAVFTGVCDQHIASFGSIENVFEAKSEIVKSGAFTVCGESLFARVREAFGESDKIAFVDRAWVVRAEHYATETDFTLQIDGKNISVKTPLLGEAAVENMLLAATLALKMGLTPEEIGVGLNAVKPIPHRLELTQTGGVYILDDGYNANPKGAEEALRALGRFAGRKCVVTPGLVECGVLETALNGKLGAALAGAGADTVILVGDTLVGAVKAGYLQAGGEAEKLFVVPTLESAKPLLSERVGAGDCVLFLNDLPDVY